MDLIKYSKYNMPPQGLKILCFKKGELWIARRFEYKGNNYWVELPFAEARAVSTDEPEYWMKVQLPQGYTGYMKIGVENGPLMTFDELMEIDKESHEKFVALVIDSFGKRLPSQPLD